MVSEIQQQPAIKHRIFFIQLPGPKKIREKYSTFSSKQRFKLMWF